jgi:hypothetical protein
LKVCPECRSRYEGDLSFCSADGTRLVDISQVAEDWSGRDLTADIYLGDFWESTPAGDRYIAHDDALEHRLLATVLNRRGRHTSSVPDSLRELLTDSPPSQVLALREANLAPEGMPPWVVEEHPECPSLRHRLDQFDDEPGALDWEVGVRITISAGRILHWMAQNDCIHGMCHAGALYCDDTGEQLRIGDWVQGAILAAEQTDDTPEDLEERWLGFEHYMAPELFDGHAPDSQTLVYRLGVVLYESIVGRPPFDGAEDVSQAHQNAERPAIADKVSGVHPELDSILDVMLAGDRDSRFDHPEAAAAALASLLSASLKTVAPDLAPRENVLFDETASADSDDSVHDLSEPVDNDADTGETLMGMPAAEAPSDQPSDNGDTPADASGTNDEPSDNRDSVVSGETESVDTANPDTPKPSDEVPTIIVDDDDDASDANPEAHPDDSQDGFAETVVDDQADDASTSSRDQAALTDELPRIKTDTLRAWHHADNTPSLGPDLPVSVIGFVDIEHADGQTTLRRVDLDNDSVAPGDNSAELPPTVPDDSAGPDTVTDSPSADDDTSAGTDDETQTTDDRDSDQTDVSSDDDSDDDDFDGIVGDFDRGSPEIDDPDDFDNEWFSKSSEDAWMEQDVREGRDQAEETRRYVLWIGLSILVLTAASVVVYAEFGPSDTTAEQPKQVAPESNTNSGQSDNPSDN